MNGKYAVMWLMMIASFVAAIITMIQGDSLHALQFIALAVLLADRF